MLHWLSQINKESFSIAGTMLFVYGTIRLIRFYEFRYLNSFVKYLIISISGIILLWLVRPYINQILLPCIALIYTGLLFFWVIQFPRPNRSDNLSFSKIIAFGLTSCLIVITLVVTSNGARSDKTLTLLENIEKKTTIINSNGNSTCLARLYSNEWAHASWLPEELNNKVRSIIAQRCLIYSIKDRNKNPITLYSFIDESFNPKGTEEALSYLPKASIIGIFSPWPNDWFRKFNENISLFYTLAALEMIVFLSTIPFFLLWLIKNFNTTILVPIIISSYLITIYSVATPLLGTLYRYRYPWWMIIFTLMIAATLSLLSSRQKQNKN